MKRGGMKHGEMKQSGERTAFGVLVSLGLMCGVTLLWQCAVGGNTETLGEESSPGLAQRPIEDSTDRVDPDEAPTSDDAMDDAKNDSGDDSKDDAMDDAMDDSGDDPKDDAMDDSGDDSKDDAMDDAMDDSADDTNVCKTLSPPGDNDDLVISKVVPGVFIEIYNARATEFILANTTYAFCVRPNYVNLGSVVGGVTAIPAKSYFRIDWPSDLPATGAEELAIYSASQFSNPNNMVDYVCWSADSTVGRKGVAETAGLWSGDCAATPSPAIARKPNTDGTSAADYDSMADTSDNGNCSLP